MDTTDARAKALLEVADELPVLTRFRGALQLTGYREMLEGFGPFTVFAPVNEGFLTSGVDSAFLANRVDTLRKIVGLHIARGDIDTLWVDSLIVSTLSQSNLTLRRNDDTLLVDGRPVLERFVVRNGILYVIPSAIKPPPPDTTTGLLERRRLQLRT